MKSVSKAPGTAAFVPCIPLPTKSQSTSLSIQRPISTRMVAQDRMSRSEKIKQLSEKLEKLRAQKERLEGTSQPSSPNTGIPTPTPPAPTLSSESSLNDIKFGKHGSGSRFLSITAVDSAEYSPRVLIIPGRSCEITAKEFMETAPALYTREPVAGNFFLSKLPEGFNGMFVAVQGNEILEKAGDPIGLLISPEEFSSVELPITEGDDVLLVVDRNVKESAELDNRAFYIWDVDGAVKVGWMDSYPKGEVRRIGIVLYGLAETKVELRKKKSCWEEENEVYT